MASLVKLLGQDDQRRHLNPEPNTGDPSHIANKSPLPTPRPSSDLQVSYLTNVSTPEPGLPPTAEAMILDESLSGGPPISQSEFGNLNVSKEPVSYASALVLLDVFFEKIQPWLPMLHRPTYQARVISRLSEGSDCVKDLPDDETFLLYSVFNLAAQVASAQPLPVELDAKVLPALTDTAIHLYLSFRSVTEATLPTLQACILLAYHFYTSGLSMQGWILVGVCIRLAYELNLSEIDDEDNDWVDTTWIEVEEMRRAWWLVWELDTFGSVIRRKPFAIDHQLFSVKLPISDEDWFDELPISSPSLLTHMGEAWRSLQGSENQDERAWFLVANHLMAMACDQFRGKTGPSEAAKVKLQTDITCFRLALPPSFQVSVQPISFDSKTFGRKNWIMGTHLMLAGASYMASTCLTEDPAGSSPIPADTSRIQAALGVRDATILTLVSQWAPEYLGCAHPFFACTFIPPCPPKSRLCLSNVSLSTKDITALVLGKFAQRWRLASIMIGM